MKEDGIVFGVELTKSLKVQHNYAETLEDAKKFSDSKYVRSDLNDSFKKVEEFLKEDRWVLFTGTSCQVQALKIYLGKEYEKLILCDIICHANPSPKVFKMYLENIEKQHGKKIKHISFRSKENGWHNQTPIIEFEDGTKIGEDTYFKAFIGELISRPSCNSCKFTSFNRQSDITIGDFWGIQKVFPDMDDDKGTSFILVNTEKGKKIFDKINMYMNTRKTQKETILQFNHHTNLKQHKKREELFYKIANNKITNDNIIKELKHYTNINIYKKTKKNIKKFLKKIMGKK